MTAQVKQLNDQPNFARYQSENEEVVAMGADTCKVVFLGNSITEGWVKQHPEFFAANKYIGRGISRPLSSNSSARNRYK